jgi:protein phosphatase
MVDDNRRVVVLVGLPGSGKSTYLERMGAPALSSDALRVLLADDATDQTIHHRVFLALRYLLRQRLALGRPLTYVDATNLTPEERAPYIRIAHTYGYVAEALLFDIPLEICRARNSRRARMVPDEALERMAGKLVPPRVEEGFAKIGILKLSP